MNRASLALALAVAAVPFAAVAAAEPPPVTDATATWIESTHVRLTVTYEGSACETPGEARVEAGPDRTDVVVIPTTETAEMCTMQIVPVTYEGIIAVEPDTTTLAITVLDANGQPKATGSATIGAPEAGPEPITE